MMAWYCIEDLQSRPPSWKMWLAIVSILLNRYVTGQPEDCSLANEAHAKYWESPHWQQSNNLSTELTHSLLHTLANERTLAWEFLQSKEAEGKPIFTSLCLHLENVPRGHPCPAFGLIHNIIPVIKINSQAKVRSFARVHYKEWVNTVERLCDCGQLEPLSVLWVALIGKNYTTFQQC